MTLLDTAFIIEEWSDYSNSWIPVGAYSNLANAQNRLWAHSPHWSTVEKKLRIIKLTSHMEVMQEMPEKQAGV